MTQSTTGAGTASAESQIQEIVPGLYRLRTPMTSNALPWIMPYAFLGPDGVSLFDSGYGTSEAQEALTAQLRVLGHAPSDVRRLIVSHAHPDHLGMATWLREQAPDHELILLGEEADWFEETHRHDSDWFERNNGWLLRHGLDPAELEEERSGPPPWKAPDVATPLQTDAATETTRRGWQMEHVVPDRRMRDGDILEFDGWRLQCVWTPGHTPGHLCVYETNHRLTFTGDHVLSRITPHVGYSGDDEELHRNPLLDYRASLQKVAALDTALALPAHEELIEDLPARCHAIIDHHDRRLEEVLDGLGSGRTSGMEIASIVTWNKPWSTFSLHKKRMALGETVSHLQLLLHEGRVRRIDDGERVLWERA